VLREYAQTGTLDLESDGTRMATPMEAAFVVATYAAPVLLAAAVLAAPMAQCWPRRWRSAGRGDRR
jgi:hypothetical protein